MLEFCVYSFEGPIINRLWTIIAIALTPLFFGAGPPIVKSAIPAPNEDALFQRADGWIGADGAYSVFVSQWETLWLFSDTWVGKIRNGQRTDATIVNNTIGVQNASAKQVTFSIAKGPDGDPTALIRPNDGRGWFWLQAGHAEEGRLLLFLNQVEKTGEKSVFGFRSIGLWLGTVTNAAQPPELWQVEQMKMPNTVFSNERVLVWGSAVLRVGDELYVYGTDELRGMEPPIRQMVVAKASIKSIHSLSDWRYFSDGDWGTEFQKASPLASEMASEYSVTPFGGGYIAVYTERGLSPRIMGRMADRPWGPWSAPTVLYECPEMNRDKNLFCYAAKAHPSLSFGQELVISYVVNSFDFWQVARQAELYWPRFVRVTLVTSN